MRFDNVRIALQGIVDGLAASRRVSTVQVVIPDTSNEFMVKYRERRTTPAVYIYNPPDNLIVINPIYLRFYQYPRGTINLLHEFDHHEWISRWGEPKVKEMKDFEHHADTEARKEASSYEEVWRQSVEPLLPRIG